MTKIKIAAQMLFAILFAGLVGFLVLGFIWWHATYPYQKIQEHLESQGYTEVYVRSAWINKAPIQCSGDSTVLATYTATRGNRRVAGFACYLGWPWGSKNWDN
jgi:hypothetical protein